MAEKTESSKFGSRKFLVWIAATVFELGAIVLGVITRDTGLAEQFTPWWGSISMLYIGGNVAQKFTHRNDDQEADKCQQE